MVRITSLIHKAECSCTKCKIMSVLYEYNGMHRQLDISQSGTQPWKLVANKSCRPFKVPWNPYLFCCSLFTLVPMLTSGLPTIRHLRYEEYVARSALIHKPSSMAILAIIYTINRNDRNHGPATLENNRFLTTGVGSCKYSTVLIICSGWISHTYSITTQ